MWTENRMLRVMALSGGVAVTALAAPALVGPAVASGDKCNVPRAEWQTKDALKAELVDKGWDVRRIKTDDGCFEAYAIDDQGRKVEVYFNPRTFEIVKQDIDD